MASDSCKFFVNGVPIDAHQGEEVIDAIQRWDSSMAEQLKVGERALTDSRGLPVGLDTRLHAGAIFRVVSNRQLRADDYPLDGNLADV
jgi:hypothetical protein